MPDLECPFCFEIIEQNPEHRCVGRQLTVREIRSYDFLLFLHNLQKMHAKLKESESNSQQFNNDYECTANRMDLLDINSVEHHVFSNAPKIKQLTENPSLDSFQNCTQTIRYHQHPMAVNAFGNNPDCASGQENCYDVKYFQNCMAENRIKQYKTEANTSCTNLPVSEPTDDLSVHSSHKNLETVFKERGSVALKIPSITYKNQSSKADSRRLFNGRLDLENECTLQERERKFSCGLCNKKFRNKCQLERHKRVHTGEKPYCKDCGKSYSQKQYLKSHRLLHFGNLPNKCEFCGKSFIQKCHLITHIRVHTGEKPFKCDKCDKCFRQVGHLKTHYKTQH